MGQPPLRAAQPDSSSAAAATMMPPCSAPLSRWSSSRSQRRSSGPAPAASHRLSSTGTTSSWRPWIKITGTPAGEALRADWPWAAGGVDAFRVPVLRPGGQHGIYNAQPFRAFDADAYSVNLTARFLATRGQVAGHEAGCDCSAAGLPGFTYNGAADTPSFEDGCQVDDLRVCDADCAAAWGLWLPEVAACVVD